MRPPPSPALLTVAKAVSVVFHPGFQQVYLLLYVAWRKHELPDLGWAILTLPLAVPAVFYWWYKRVVLKGETLFAMHRKDRFWPVTVNVLSLMGLAGYIYAQGLHTAFAPDGRVILSTFSLTLICIGLNILAFSITLGYKISLHMLGTASSCFVFYGPQYPWLPLLVGAVALPVVGWSRLLLKGHTYPEVVAGATVGSLFALAALAVLDFSL